MCSLSATENLTSAITRDKNFTEAQRQQILEVLLLPHKHKHRKGQKPKKEMSFLESIAYPSEQSTPKKVKKELDKNGKDESPGADESDSKVSPSMYGESCAFTPTLKEYDINLREPLIVQKTMQFRISAPALKLKLHVLTSNKVDHCNLPYFPVEVSLLSFVELYRT